MKAIKIFDRIEGRVAGIYLDEAKGEFLAMTFTQSKTFKTQGGAERWMAARGYA